MTGISEVVAGIPAEFASEISAEEALARVLRLKRWEKGKLEIIGEVNADRVSIRILHTFRRSNQTRFEGVIVTKDTGTAIVGRFVASLATRLVAGAFLAAIACFAFGGLMIGLHELFTQQLAPLDALLQVALLTTWLVGVGLFAYVQIWNASPTKNDVVAISAALNEALKSAT